PGDADQQILVAPERVTDLAQAERETLPGQEGDAGGTAVLPREIDAEKSHAGGRAMLPAITVTAEPPTRTRPTTPSRTRSSTRSRPGRPRPSPCSAVNSTMVPAGRRSPASSSHRPIEEWSGPWNCPLGPGGGEGPASGSHRPMEGWTEPVTMSSGMP